jgi:hypothetical protein
MEILNTVVANGSGQPDPIATLSLAEEFGGESLLISDVRIALMLVNAARRTIVDRMFGVDEDQRNLLTLIAVLMMAGAVHDRAHRLLRVPAGPTRGDWILGDGLFQELLCSIAGPTSREPPILGTLLASAVVVGAVRPALVKSADALAGSSRRTSAHFHHRYGYLIDPGHWRGKRAQWRARRSAAVVSPPARA